MSAPHAPLVEAIHALRSRRDPEVARQCWTRWRTRVGLDSLDAASFRLVPAFGQYIPEWISEEKDRNILLGICRQAWSRNQVQRKILNQTWATLREQNLEPLAVIGPLSWAELYWPSGIVRSTGLVDLLMPVDCIAPAVTVLASSGWQARGKVPPPKQLLFGAPTVLEDARGSILRLHARVLANTDLALRPVAAPPVEAADGVQINDANGTTLQAVPAEYSFAAVLDGYLEDGLDWRADALMILESAPLNWDTIGALIADRASARARLSELKTQWGLNLPEIETPRGWRPAYEPILLPALRAWRQMKGYLP